MSSARKKPASRRKNQHVDTDELWIYSYSDLVSLLLGFFIILYSLAIAEKKDSSSENLSKKIAEAFNSKTSKPKTQEDPLEISAEDRYLRALELLVAITNLAPSTAEAVDKIERFEAQQAVQAASKDELLSKIDAGMKKLAQFGSVRDDSLLEMVFPETIMFHTASATLSPSGETQLLELIPSIKRIEDLIQIEITGHTDSTLKDKKQASREAWSLSTARAGSVAQFLVEKGVEPRIITARGLAFYHPLFEEYTPFGEAILENMKRNRRVHIVFKHRTLDAPAVRGALP